MWQQFLKLDFTNWNWKKKNQSLIHSDKRLCLSSFNSRLNPMLMLVEAMDYQTPVRFFAKRVSGWSCFLKKS